MDVADPPIEFVSLAATQGVGGVGVERWADCATPLRGLGGATPLLIDVAMDGAV